MAVIGTWYLYLSRIDSRSKCRKQDLTVIPRLHRVGGPMETDCAGLTSYCGGGPERRVRSRDSGGRHTNPLFPDGPRIAEVVRTEELSQKPVRRATCRKRTLCETLHWGTGGGDPFAADSGSLIRHGVGRKQSGTRFPKQAAAHQDPVAWDGPGGTGQIRAGNASSIEPFFAFRYGYR